jgi:tetratricopeptide (TPR) repeat protein
MADEHTQHAFEAYKHALATDPTIPEIHFNAAFFFLRNANYDRAREHFLTYLQLGDDETKRAEAKKAVNEIEAHNLLDTMFREAYDLIRMNREEEGIAKVRQFLASSPDVWNGWFLLGWAHRRLGRYTEARDAFEKALELGSTETDTLNELSICHMELGDYDAAYRRLTQALRQEPENVKVISNLGILSMKREETDEALGYFRAALEIEPDDPIAKRYLEYLTRERT